MAKPRAGTGAGPGRDAPEAHDAADVPEARDAAGDRPTGTQAIDRAMAVLRLFATGRTDLGLLEIAAGAELSPSTAHRIVRALCRAGLVEQDVRTERYQLGRASIVLF